MSIVEDAVNNETSHHIWIEIEPDMTGEVSVEEGFVLLFTATHNLKPYTLQAE